MFFKRVKKKTAPTGTERMVGLACRGFYLHERPENPKNALYCLYPLDESGDLEFASLAKEYAGILLSQFPAVINQCHSIFGEDVQKEKFAQAYLQAGGKPFFLENQTMLTFSNGMDERLLNYISEQEFACYEFTFYGYESMIFAKSREKDYIIKIDYHVEHDFLQMEMKSMTNHMIKQIQEICQKHDRVLTGYDQILR